MSAYEEVLERRIEDAYQAFLSAKTPEGRQAHFQNMRALSYQLTATRLWRLKKEGQSA